MRSAGTPVAIRPLSGAPFVLVGPASATMTRRAGPGPKADADVEVVAEYLGVPVTTICDWRVDDKGPCGVRVGRHVKFTVSDVLAWIADQRQSRPGQQADGR